MPNWLIKLVQAALVLALPLVLLLGNIQLFTHSRFLNYEYGTTGFPPDRVVPLGGYALSKAERTALAEVALSSIIGSEGIRILEEARFLENGAPAFNAREIRHMRDVRWLFLRLRILFWMALAALLGGIAVLLWWGRRSGRGPRLATRPLLVSVIATLSIAGAIGLYILLNFSSFFTSFHHVFFEGDTWLFRQDDTLIRLFPTDLWFDATSLIAGLTIVELILIGVVAWWGDRKGD